MNRLNVTAVCLLGMLGRIAAAEFPAQGGSLQWQMPPVEGPGLHSRTFDSAVLKTEVGYCIYTPPEYDAENGPRYPVVYWMHGAGGSQRSIPDVARRFDEAVRGHKIPPLLVVFANGLTGSMWCDSKDGRAPVETVFIRELIPHIDATCRTVASREGRLIEGFSMGGFGAARLGFKYHDLFGAVSILAGALQNEATISSQQNFAFQRVFGGDMDYFRKQSPWMLAEQNVSAAAEMKIRMVVGDRDPTQTYNREYDRHLARLGIAHTFEICPGAGHNAEQIYEALGEQNWKFYRDIFAGVSGGERMRRE